MMMTKEVTHSDVKRLSTHVKCAVAKQKKEWDKQEEKKKKYKQKSLLLGFIDDQHFGKKIYIWNEKQKKERGGGR